MYLGDSDQPFEVMVCLENQTNILGSFVPTKKLLKLTADIRIFQRFVYNKQLFTVNSYKVNANRQNSIILRNDRNLYKIIIDPLSVSLLVPLPGCQIQILIETQHGADVYGLVALASKHSIVYFRIASLWQCNSAFTILCSFLCTTRDCRTSTHAWVKPLRQHNLLTTFLCGAFVVA